MLKSLRLPIKYEASPAKDDRFYRLRVYVMHDGLNLNNSFFTMEAIQDAADSIKNIPILAFVRQQDGTDYQDFGGHEMELVVKENDVVYRYLGRPIGVIPETGNNYHYAQIDDKNYVVVDGYVWADYANEALDILKRDGVKGQSMEIRIDDYAYDPEKDYFVITKYRYTGLTLLGDDVTPAMQGAKAELIGNYSVNESATFKKIVYEVNKLHSKRSEDLGQMKGGNQMEDILQKYGYTKEGLAEKGLDVEKYSAEALDAVLEFVKKADELEQLKAEFTAVQEELKKAKEEAKQYQAEVGKIAKEKDELQEQFEVYKQEVAEKHQALEQELAELREYKENEERAKHETAAEKLFEQFSKLPEEEIAELRENVHSFSLEELEKELYYRYGLMAAQQEDPEQHAPKRKPTVNFSIDLKDDLKMDDEPIYADLFKKDH